MNDWAERILAAKQRPSAWPAEVMDRLLRYERERAERMAGYERAWERRWREADAAARGIHAAPAVASRNLWRVK